MASLRAGSFGVLTLSGVLLLGCGDDTSRPGLDTDTDGVGTTSVELTGSTTVAGSSSTGDPSTATDPSTSSTTEPADGSTSTGASVDQPPTITLTVAGQARPETLAGADLVPLEADASDDVAIDRVEFYRDGELLSTDEEAPYAAEVLLTSLDNASIEFHAVAYDDADQSTDSETVSLEVNVIGANIVHVATDLLAAGGLAYAPGGGVQLGEDGSVYVATSTLDETENAFGLRAARVSPDLSTLDWEVRVPAVATPDGDEILVTGEPLLIEAADRLLIAGTSITSVGGAFEATVVSVALDGSSATVPYSELGDDENSFNIPGLVAGPDNDIILHGPGDTLSRISAGLPVWQVPTVAWNVSDLGATHMSSDAGGDILLDALTCTGDPCTWTVHKIAAADGAEAWQTSLPVEVDLSDFHVGASVTAPNGDVVLGYGQSAAAGGDIQLVRWDADGNPLGTLTVDSGDAALTVSDIEFDAQGQLVLFGSRVEDDGADANLLRVSPEGTVLWSRSFGFGTERDLSLAFTLDTRGRVVVAGLADPQVGFVVFAASLWLATVDL